MGYHTISGIAGTLGGADNGFSQNTLDIRRGDRSVMLSAAKHLSARCDRPFAAAQGDSVGADFIVQINLLKFIIGDGHEKSAPTGVRGIV